jgi:hypothetical protein
MSNQTTRRAVLAGAAPAKVAPHPSETELLRIEDEYWKAVETYKQSMKKCAAAERRYNKIAPENKADEIGHGLPPDLQ